MDNQEVIGESYHDVMVIVDGVEYNLFNSPFGYQLTCSRVSGWELWYWLGDIKDAKLIGGEFNSNKEFKILINGKIICHSKNNAPITQSN